MNDEKMVEMTELELLEVEGGNLPAAEAFCTGGVWHSPRFAGIRFIQDPCNTIDHPFPF